MDKGKKSLKLKGKQWFTLLGLLFFLVAVADATAYDGPYDRSFYVNRRYDAWDTNLSDGVPDGNPNELGVQTTLRAALMEANAQGGTTLITLDTGTYENTITQQFISANVIIEGQGPDRTILEGNHIQRVISVGDIFDGTNYTVIIIGVTIQNGTVSQSGGGVMNWASTVTLSNVVVTGCAVSDPVQYTYGGGIRNRSFLTLENCTVNNNYAGGEGGGISNGGVLTIVKSTISDNTAAQGGGIATSGGSDITNVTNSTISGNTAAVRGGGIYNYYGGGTLTNVTIAYNKAPGNAGGGIYQYSDSRYPGATLRNTIVAHNLGGNCGGLLSNIKDDGGNLSFGGGCGLQEGNPILGPLQDNGGPTFTHALFRGSAAIDAAVGGPGTDQRGVARPQDGDGDGSARADIGAFECEGIPPVPRSDISVSPASYDFGDVLVGESSTPVELTISNSGPLALVISGMTLLDTSNCSLDVNGGANPCGSTTPTIAMGANCTVTVTFNPSSAGAPGTSLIINSNDPDEPTLIVSLTGNGVLPAPDISISPPSLEFGDVMIGYSSDQTVTVSNEGSEDLTIGTIASADSLAEPFALVTDGCSGQTISLGGNCTITLRFSPTSEGVFADTFDIPSDDPDEDPLVVNVSGTGITTALVAETFSETDDGGNGNDYTWGTAIDSQGSVIAAGYIKAPSASDYGDTAHITKYDADGNVVWTETMEVGPVEDPKLDSNDQFYDAAVDSEDNIIVVGRKSGTWATMGYHQAMVTRKYDPDGTLLWEKTHHEFAWNSAYGVAVDASDNIYVAGNVFTNWTIAQQWAILKYDKDGTLQSGFPVHYNYSPSEYYVDAAYDVAVDDEGNFIAVGERGVSQGNLDWHVRKYDSNRNLVWEDTYSGPANLADYARGVAVDSEGDVFVAGYTDKGGGNYDWLIIKYAASNGERLWTRTFESAPGRSEVCYDVVVDGLDNILVGGNERDADGVVHWRLERLSGEDGSLINAEVWDAANNQSIYALALRDKQLAIGGYENNGTDNDMRTYLGVYFGEPDIAVSPSRLDFGEVTVGSSSDKIVSVRNNGIEGLTIAMIALADLLAEPFDIVTDDCSGQTIAPGESCTFTVRFTPSGVDEFTDTFDIPSDHPSESPIMVSASGTGVEPSCEGNIGPESWSDVYDGGSGHDYIWGVAIDSQGNMVAAGYFTSAVANEYDTGYVVKYDSHGNVLWTDTLEIGPVVGQKADSYDRLFGVAVDSEDNIIVVGRQSGTWTTYTMGSYHGAAWIRKYNPDGSLIWEDVFQDGGGSPWQQWDGVAVDSDDNIYVGGSAFANWSVGQQWVISKYDKDGNLQAGFPERYNYSTSTDPADLCYDVAVDEDGNFIAVGIIGISGANYYNWHVRKYNAARELVWEDTYDGKGLHDYARGVAVDSNGDVFVVGLTNKGTDNSSNADYDWLIIKYAAADGQRLWTRTFESAPGRSEACYDVVVDGADNVLVGGYERQADDTLRWRLERLSGDDGTLLDQLVCDADYNLNIFGLALRDGQIALGGYEDNGTDNDMRTTLVLYYPPVIALLGDKSITLEAGTSYEEPGFTATDNYQGGDITSDVVVTGSVDNTVPGRYILHYNVNDSQGASAPEKTRAVNVVDTTPPVIALLGDNPLELEVGTPYSEPGYTVSDNSAEDITSDVVVTGSVYHDVLGSYTLNYNVSDLSGNPAEEKTRTVNVVKPPAPLLDVTPITEVQSGQVPIHYTTRDYEGDFMEVTISFTSDGGSTWLSATHGTGGDGTLNVSSSWAGEPHTFIWDSVADLGGVVESAVEIEIIVSDGSSESEPVTIGPFSVDNTSLDGDNDKLPDAWEQLIVDADPDDEIDDVSGVLKDDDFDGDGKTNNEEYLAGTDPTDPESTFIAAPGKGSWAISWESVAGKFYRVYYCNELGEEWILLGFELPGDGATYIVVDEVGAGLFRRFYKVGVH